MVFPYDIPWVTPNALTDNECDYIRELALPNLEWSAISPAGHINHTVRMSETTWLDIKSDPNLEKIFRRFISEDDWDKCENLQVLRYKLGGFYRPHQDATEKHTNRRKKTRIFCLNNEYEGGETVFPTMDRKYKLDKGDMLKFSCLDKDGNLDPYYLHGGERVKSGTKWVCNLWTRQSVYDPNQIDETYENPLADCTLGHVTPDDIEKIIDLESVVYNTGNERPSPNFIEKLVTAAPKLSLVVKDKDGDLIGAMYGGLVKGAKMTNEKIEKGHDPTGDTLTVFSISVRKDLQGKGIGKSIADYYYKTLVPESGIKVDFYSTATRPQYLDWMEKDLGFTVVGPSKITYGDEYWYDVIKFVN